MKIGLYFMLISKNKKSEKNKHLFHILLNKNFGCS